MKIKLIILYLCVGLGLHAMSPEDLAQYKQYQENVSAFFNEAIRDQGKDRISIVRLPEIPENLKHYHVTRSVVNNFNKNKRVDQQLTIGDGTVGEFYGGIWLDQIKGYLLYLMPPVDKKNTENFQFALENFKTNMRGVMVHLTKPSFVLGIPAESQIEDEVVQILKQVPAFKKKEIVFIPPLEQISQPIQPPKQQWSYLKWLLYPATILGGAFLAWAIKSGYFSKYFGDASDMKQ